MSFVSSNTASDACSCFTVVLLILPLRMLPQIMGYDDMGDTYSVMTRAGPKHFVERDAISDDIVVNPSDGSCAQQ